MVNINEIKDGIQKSIDYYKKEIKESLNGQVSSDYNYFSTSESDLDLRVNGLTIEYSSIFDNSIIDYKYNGLQNKVIINKKYLKREDINLNNLFMDIALNIAYYNPDMKCSGFGNENYEALNKGFREILALNIVGMDRSSEYFESDEYVYANLLSRIFDLSTFWYAYKENEPDYFRDELSKRSIEFGDKFSKLNEIANRNYKTRNNKKELSSLDEIEYKLFDLKLLDEPNKENLDDFISNMISSSNIFKDEKRYKRLDRVNITTEYQNYLESSISNQHTI